MAGANAGTKRRGLPKIPDISKPAKMFPGSAGIESKKAPRDMERENRASMHEELRRHRRKAKDDSTF